MHTIKLVIIGDSGVGKTSIRGKYIDGRFSTGYRATIGTDFITKNVPHHSRPDETVTLQIWDTAGQERFSGLSAAFFRGADAVMLVFDVNRPQTLEGLRKWWNEFKARAPVADEEAEDYCCIVVGNKADLVDETWSSSNEPNSVVTETEAMNFLEELVPRSTSKPGEFGEEHPHIEVEDFDQIEGSSRNGTSADPSTTTRTQSINILRPSSSTSSKDLHQKRTKKSESHSSERSPLRGTMTTSRTSLSIYHTPASSLFGSTYDSAPSTPMIQSPPPPPPPPDVDSSPSTSPSKKRQSQRFRSASSSSSGTTITPSLFTNKQQRKGNSASDSALDANNNHSARILSPKPEKRPRLFFTSAKTGQGLTDAFEYVARRVVTRWEYEEELESRMMHIRDTTDDTFRLDGSNDSHFRAKKWASALTCCRT